MTLTSRARKLVGASAVGLVGVTAAAGMAEAAVVDTDTVLINGGHADFGRLAHVFGTPVAGGDVVFSVNSGVVTASVTGRTHLDDLAGSCARVRLQFLRADNTVIPGLTTTGLDECSAFSGLHTSDLWTRSRSNSQIAKVRVSTQILNNAGQFVTTASRTTVMDDN